MGYTLILVSDNTALWANTPQGAIDLMALLGADSYPGTDYEIHRTYGAWTLVASVHSTTSTVLEVSDNGSHMVAINERVDQDGIFFPAGNHPAREDAVGVWWVYADSVPWTNKNSVWKALASLLNGRATYAQVGSYANAINYAGDVLGGSVELHCNGLRVYSPDASTAGK